MDAPPPPSAPSSVRGRESSAAAARRPSLALGPFRHGPFGLFLASRFGAILATQMVSVAIAWQIYERTGAPLALGFTGLAQFAPMFVLAPITGDVADRFDRRALLLGCHAVFMACCLALAWLAGPGERLLVVPEAHGSGAISGGAGPGVAPIYAVLAVIGAARAFWMPTGQALMPALVPRAEFPRAVAWNSACFQVASIGGPALGGTLIGLAGVRTVFLLATGLALLAFTLLAFLRYQPEARAVSTGGWRRLGAGVAFIRSRPVILGAISLDLFAVLLGGATALMPIYASDILHVGSSGLGWLRAAPALGAGLVGLGLALRPIRRKAGLLMFACVTLFGLTTIAFGISTSFPLSFLVLVVLGGADMVSVVIRQTVVQVSTPSEMRGRVAAVNLVFIGASNELGEAESGLTAHWLGTVPAVVWGGIGTLLVTALWAARFPALRRIERPEDLAAVPLARIHVELDARAAGCASDLPVDRAP